jgi:hypothetical protein
MKTIIEQELFWQTFNQMKVVREAILENFPDTRANNVSFRMFENRHYDDMSFFENEVGSFLNLLSEDLTSYEDSYSYHNIMGKTKAEEDPPRLPPDLLKIVQEPFPHESDSTSDADAESPPGYEYITT